MDKKTNKTNYPGAYRWMLKLGGELEKLYPVEWEHLSMMEIIETHYGTAAVSLIESLT